jgi:chromosome segregation ATPase
MSSPSTPQKLSVVPDDASPASADSTQTDPAPASSEIKDWRTQAATLQAALQKAQQQEQTLQAQIDSLQTRLDQQTEQIQHLQAQLQPTHQLQAALEKAEAAARHLAALNEQLTAENALLKTPSTTALATPSKQSQFASLSHPVFPNSTLPSGMSDQEVGWFD